MESLTSNPELENSLGQNRKSRTTVLMSVMHLKAEVSLSRFDVRYVPLAEVAVFE